MRVWIGGFFHDRHVVGQFGFPSQTSIGCILLGILDLAQQVG